MEKQTKEMIKKNLTTAKLLKDASEGSVGRTQFYWISTILAVVFLVVDFVALIGQIFRFNSWIFAGIVLHFVLSVKLIKIAIVGTKHTIAHLIKTSPELLESAKAQDREKLNAYLANVEEVPGGDFSKGLRLLIFLIAAYIGMGYFVYTLFV